MPSPQQIDQALRQVRDQSSFIQTLLFDTLKWPNIESAKRVEDISYGWTQDELRTAELDRKIVDGQVWQLQPLEGNQPWGIFLLEFKSPDAFVTGRGMTGPLRKVLRGLVPSRRKAPHAKSWNREHLLFLCTHNYQHFRIAYFKSPPDRTTAAPLAAFGWGPDVPSRTACEFNLPHLVWPDDPSDSDVWVRKWAEAFDVEKVTKKFYEEYAAAFTEVEGRIKDASGIKDAENLRLFTQTLFNRLMFLRFIERKGWLQFNDRRDYLAALMQAAGIGKKSVYQSRLRPLFFEGLAIEGKQESAAIGKVPFLNGGLFEENELDKAAKDVPDTALAPMIGSHGLFYHFNFTVEESTPLDIEVAVDPEMLGKVFERLVTGRHETGSYYTPKPIVSFMCREALKHYLTTSLQGEKPEALARMVDDHDAAGLKNAEAVLAALRAVTVCDPACGSGAYLLGMLHELLELRGCLFVSRNVDTASAYQRKLEIIENNLYGVDIDTFAVNIARLRLWLSLAVEYAGDVPPPLPNLDFKIEVGDSLAAPDPQTAFSGQAGFRGDLLKQFREKKAAFLEAHGDDKKRLHAEIDELRADLAVWLHSQAAEGAFDWATEFAEVFEPQSPNDKRATTEPGGFDIIVANPPYIDSERMTRTNPELRRIIQASYSFTKGNWDIYIAFFERGFNLLNNHGVLTYITPDKWISKPFGDAMRLATTNRLTCILNAGRTVFEGSKVDAIVSSFTAWDQHSVRVCEYRADKIIQKRVIEKHALKPPYPYDWLFSEFIDLLTRLDTHEQCLSSYGLCENACATSDAYKLKPFIEEEPKRPRVEDYLRIINTGTIGKYVSKWGQRQMVYLGNKFTRPVVKRDRFLKEFQNTYGKKSIKPKIIIKGLNLLDACLDEDGTVIPGKSTLIISSPSLESLKVLLCIVNSSLASFYLKEKYPASSYNQGITYTKDMLNQLPVPSMSSRDWHRLVSLCDSLISIKQTNLSANASAVENEINDAVLATYCLSTEEFATVKANSR
jgi:hypothetical protein